MLSLIVLVRSCSKPCGDSGLSSITLGAGALQLRQRYKAGVCTDTRCWRGEVELQKFNLAK